MYLQQEILFAFSSSSYFAFVDVFLGKDGLSSLFHGRGIGLCDVLTLRGITRPVDFCMLFKKLLEMWTVIYWKSGSNL